MQELSDYENRLNDLKDKNNLAKLVTELEKANAELLESQRAAPGLIEDALLSKEALRTNESRMRKQKEAFQAAINGASLADSLKIITSLVQGEMAPNTRTAFYISDAEGKFLHPVWGAASMSDGYLQKINGFLIGKDSLACGLAISLGKPVLTADVLNEPLWKPWIYLAKEFNFRGCWSFPVKTGENKPVGTFALYFEEPHEANQKDVSLAEIITQTAAVLISNNIDTQKREQAEEALRKSEAKYRTIFDTTNDGFAIIEMIFDETGKAVDFIYREANPALILQTGVNLAGKSSKEVFPDMHQSILDAYGNVAKNGISVQQEYSIQALGQWFQTTASRISEGDKNLVSVISRNITGRKRLEQQQEFRLKLSDAIRHLSDPKKIEEEVTRIAMDHFSANKCYFCVINGENLIISHEAATEGLPSVAGTYLLSSFPLFKKVIDSGSVFVINDAKTSKVIDEDLRALCLQLKVISFIDVPVIKHEKAVGILCLVQSTPRNWSDEEIELANETAERVWSAMERAKAEEALHQSEARLKTTMDSATDYAIITTDPDRIIESWSTGAEKIFGYKEEEVVGKSADLIFTEENRNANIPQHEMEIAREKGSSKDERWHLRKNGSKFFASGVMSPIKNDRLTGYVKVARDMTEQKQSEENLMVWEERYRIALQSAQMAAWDWNITEDNIIWNDQHYYLLGLPLENSEKKASYFLQFVHPDDREQIVKAFEKAVNETGIYQEDFRIRRKDNGEVRWMHGFGQVIRKKDGRAARMVGVMFDITDRKQMEQQKEDFIIVASHELKTPVTSIKAYSEILEETCHEGNFELVSPIVKKLNGQVERLIELIHMLLDMSKIREGQLALYKQAFDLNRLITERIEEMPKVHATHKLFFSEKESMMVNADRERIGQVITNLVSNAIKYSPHGGRISIDVKKDEDFVKISVQDEGIGISEDAKKKIFDRFFRVKDLQISTYPGMGMGLFITANIVHQHGGEIWVESTPGKGSAFYFTLPVNENQG